MCPNSSLSNSVSTTAAQLMVTSRRARRGPCSWSADATSSLPLPVSPVMSAVRACGARRRIRRKSSCIAGSRPIIPPHTRWRAASWSAAATARRRSLSARTAASSCPRRREVDRLAQVVHRPRLDRLDGAVDRRMPGHQHGLALRVRLADRTENVEAADLRQLQIDERNVRRLGVEILERLGSATAGHDLEAGAIAEVAQQPENAAARRRPRAARGGARSSVCLCRGRACRQRHAEPHPRHPERRHDEALAIKNGQRAGDDGHRGKRTYTRPRTFLRRAQPALARAGRRFRRNEKRAKKTRKLYRIRNTPAIRTS